jgi:hypothetical protein
VVKRRVAKKCLQPVGFSVGLGSGWLWRALSTDRRRRAIAAVGPYPKWWPVDWRVGTGWSGPLGRPHWLLQRYRRDGKNETCSICHHQTGTRCVMDQSVCLACPASHIEGRREARGEQHETREDQFGAAVALVARLKIEKKRPSPQALQRHLKVGFHVAVELLDRMIVEGVVEKHIGRGSV